MDVSSYTLIRQHRRICNFLYGMVRQSFEFKAVFSHRWNSIHIHTQSTYVTVRRSAKRLNCWILNTHISFNRLYVWVNSTGSALFFSRDIKWNTYRIHAVHMMVSIECFLIHRHTYTRSFYSKIQNQFSKTKWFERRMWFEPSENYNGYWWLHA